MGSSGAWVILGRKLCGFIVAIRQDVPWAYMAPIDPILNDIKVKLGALDVRLPVRGEIETLATSTGSKLSSTAEKGVETASSDVYDPNLQDIQLFSSLYLQEGSNIPLMPNNGPTTSRQNEDATHLDLINDITEVSRPTGDSSRPAASLFLRQELSSGISTCTSIFTGSNASTAGVSSRNYFDLVSSSKTRPRKTWVPWVSSSEDGSMSHNSGASLITGEYGQRRKCYMNSGLENKLLTQIQRFGKARILRRRFDTQPTLGNNYSTSSWSSFLDGL